MFKKTAIFTSSIILLTISVFSQEVISTQGDSYVDSTARIDFTIGEVVTFTGTSSENNLTQGFHQTNWSFVSIENHVPNYEAIIYPNPTEDLLNIKASLYEDVSYALYDEMGKLILQGLLSGEQTALEVSPLATGRYSLVLSNSKENLKTFNIIKTR
tara:strand:- start:177 stop:647 length:471 start_codon:yes stop_codon:yes gene_type:complete